LEAGVLKSTFMKPVIILITCFLITVILLLNSCKKEYSCEGCIGNNHPPLAVAGPDTVITLPSIALFNSCKKDACEDCITHSPVANATPKLFLTLRRVLE
jgi:hypothetical protein